MSSNNCKRDTASKNAEFEASMKACGEVYADRFQVSLTLWVAARAGDSRRQLEVVAGAIHYLGIIATAYPPDPLPRLQQGDPCLTQLLQSALDPLRLDGLEKSSYAIAGRLVPLLLCSVGIVDGTVKLDWLDYVKNDDVREQQLEAQASQLCQILAETPCLDVANPLKLADELMAIWKQRRAAHLTLTAPA